MGMRHRTRLALVATLVTVGIASSVTHAQLDPNDSANKPAEIEPLAAGSGPAEAASAAVAQGAALFRGLADPDVLGRWTTWVFLYLCLCVGAHMAPSGTDIKGGAFGLALALAALLAVNVVVAFCGGQVATLERFALAAVAPLLVLLLLALILGVAFLLVVLLVTAPLPDRAGAQSS